MRYEDEIRIEEEERRRYEERRRRRRARIRRQRRIRVAIMLSVPVVMLLVILLVSHFIKVKSEAETVMAYDVKYVAEAPDYQVELLDINEYSRPGTALSAINGIVIHYTANPGTTAEQNRSYFQNLKDTGETYASSHFVIGIDGEIVQCVPCNEIAYASNERNEDTISIECCIPDETGKFSEATYQSLVELVTWLMGRYDLGTDEVIRHYDVTGKECPKYYVENETEWFQFKEDLLSYIEVNGIAKSKEIQ
ncbi:MAG: peptidoglycan recognition family protein [Clostridiales bacterium]|nr:peptidoglycan recognition protein family protein [Roseburia sp.]MDD7635601.1 peptidoglycan recognition family protein [Clostridiales bacterium]MDY4111997.1 peptidoglycan recognition family protein [Roseburia sp.]